MKQVKLHIYNYGEYQIADFKNHYHDAVQCMKAMNDSLIKSHGRLPNQIFYYITYKMKCTGRILQYIDSTAGLDLSDVDAMMDHLYHTDYKPL